MVEKARKALSEGNFLETFAPLGEWNYELACERWGTKWDVNDAEVIDVPDEYTIIARYMTAWSPPIAFYETLEQQGFEVLAEYFEPGVGFVGRYTDGTDFEYSVQSKEQLEDVPTDLVETWGLDTYFDDFDEEIDNA
jgi:hypothetical protein